MKALEHFIRHNHPNPLTSAWDHGTFKEVVLDDCYNLHDRQFAPSDVVIDIGANIGFFSGLALEKGAGLVISVEPSPRNFIRLAANLEPYGTRSFVWNRAAWRSDQPPTMLHLEENTTDGNTGGITVLPDNGDTAVVTISLDTLIGSQQIAFLKIDCEGSEYPILYTATKLAQVREIAIECHPVNHLLRPQDATVGDPSPEGLAELLISSGFTTQATQRDGMPHGWAYIYAKR